jgi:hypothetical protein
MINFADELAWLNHRLDDLLESWRKKHQFHGRLCYSSVNSVILLVVLYICKGLYKGSINGVNWLSPAAVLPGENIAAMAWLCSLAISLSLLLFSLLARHMYAKLLREGHSLKAKIYKAHIDPNNTSTELGQDPLSGFQNRLSELLSVERSFPVPKKDKSLIYATLMLLLHA